MRILYLVRMFLSGINGFLKAKRAITIVSPGRPLSVSTPQTVAKINEIVCRDCHMSIRMIAETVSADKETVRKILHDELDMK